ncbi:MAG: xanthine dehydrogenase family protein molybdopterin-binding subunit, partial [Acidobacteriota bacterium]|nr:xanthine dehydrogenase family protein molybdopterin-binding subunit [Acidobacteriota bacterium]
MTAPTAPKFIGSPIRRKEDPRLITGKATYTDDVALPGMAHVALVRSPEAHARIVSIDCAEAQDMPGVVAVYTGMDLQDALAPLPCVHSIENLEEPAHLAVALDIVRYTGDGVAVVVAETAAAAEDAARHVHVEYE